MMSLNKKKTKKLIIQNYFKLPSKPHKKKNSILNKELIPKKNKNNLKKMNSLINRETGSNF